MNSVYKMIFLLLLVLSSMSFADEDLGGYGTDRLESESKLLVPTEIKKELWHYLHQYFKDESHLKKIHPEASSDFSVEYFKDTYFDDSSFNLLHGENAVRRRERLIPDDPTHPKHGRILIQMKLKAKSDDYRYEIKYPPVRQKSFLVGPIAQQIETQYHEDFLRRLRLLNIEASALSPQLVIEQKRSRVYLKIKGTPFLTITFDEAKSDVFIWSVDIDEVEIELNEIAFTGANETQRRQMLEISTSIKTDLLTKFPQLKQDQTPKYNKVYVKLDEKVPVLPQLLKMRAWFL